MNLQIFLAIVGLAIATDFDDKTSIPASVSDMDAKVIFAGAVEGKAFWAITEPDAMNWTTAGSKCIERNMNYAEITSQTQAQVIVAAFNATPGFPCCSYWTSGRDALETRQFSWNNSGIDVSHSDLRMEESFLDINNARSCVMFNVRTGRLAAPKCDTAATRAYICEVSIGQEKKI